jgi:hypothetical protein
MPVRRKPLFDSWTGLPITMASCPYDRPSTGKPLRTVAPHPSVAKWLRKYKNLGGWLKEHPGENVGRLLGKVPPITYFSWIPKYNRGVRRFNYAPEKEITSEIRSRTSFTIYPDFKAWLASHIFPVDSLIFPGD